MSMRFLRALALAAACIAAGLGAYGILRPQPAFATCGGPNCFAPPPCDSKPCMAPAPCDIRPCMVDIVTDSEAALPPGAPKRHLDGLGLRPGPDIVQVYPAPGAVVHSPFTLRIDFRPYRSAPVDPASVRVIYEKNPEVDLTPRLKPYISAAGVWVQKARLPPGNHPIAVFVADDNGDPRYAVVNITVAPR